MNIRKLPTRSLFLTFVETLTLASPKTTGDLLPVATRRFYVPLIGYAFLMCLVSVTATAQRPRTHSLPKVGTIKDYPATGLMTGCGNLYFYKAADANSTTANYVFLSRGDGSHAWMNLNGGDVRLRKIKIVEGSERQFGRIYYRYGQVRITGRFGHFKPRDTAAESDPMFSMTITLQRKKAVRIVRAVGSADC